MGERWGREEQDTGDGLSFGMSQGVDRDTQRNSRGKEQWAGAGVGVKVFLWTC